MALARVAISFGGELNVKTQGTRKEIIAEIMEWSATWGSPLSREQAETMADQTIKATRPRWGWFIVFMIVAVLWVGLLLQLSLTSSELALASGSAATGSPLGQHFDHGSDFGGGGSGCDGRFRPI